MTKVLVCCFSQGWLDTLAIVVFGVISLALTQHLFGYLTHVVVDFLSAITQFKSGLGDIQQHGCSFLKRLVPFAGLL